MDTQTTADSDEIQSHVVLEGDRVGVSRGAVKRSRLLSDAGGEFDAFPLPGVSKAAFSRWVKQKTCDAGVGECLQAVQVRAPPCELVCAVYIRVQRLVHPIPALKLQ